MLLMLKLAEALAGQVATVGPKGDELRDVAAARQPVQYFVLVKRHRFTFCWDEGNA